MQTRPIVLRELIMNFDEFKHHPVMEDITNYICSRVSSEDKAFFRPEVAYFLSKMATCMRTTIQTQDRGSTVPNTYAICLSPSGTGKGFSVDILETEFIDKFKTKFTKHTMNSEAERNMEYLAQKRAIQNGTDDNDEMDRLYREYTSYGEYPFTFDSGTVPAVKQLRTKLLLSNSGSINFMMDEVGSNFLNATELMTTYLELYDQGKVKQKLIKSSLENKRVEELEGRTPSNMLLFGTPTKLLDGSLVEKHFYEFLEVGYARRCLFAWGLGSSKSYLQQTPQEAFDNLVTQQKSLVASNYSSYFESLADYLNLNQVIQVPPHVSVALLEYRFYCDSIADNLPEHEELKRVELSHRHSKVLKLAGTYAFIDKSSAVTIEHLQAAMKLVEESGQAFERILDKEPSYARLARYISNVSGEVTHADLMEALPFYKSSTGQRNEQMALATAWGYKHHIILKKNFIDGIEFFSGDRLKENNLEDLVLSYSDNMTEGYENVTAQFEDLKELVVQPDLHFLNHHLNNGYRSNANVIEGFNMLVFDIDGTASLEIVRAALEEYQYLIYTTKSHTDEVHRFRLILPINYNLTLDADDYRATVSTVMEWLPFEVDEVSNQRSRKWRTNELADVYTNEGELVDILKFIPRTQKNEQFNKQQTELQDLSSLERWFAEKMITGNRNKTMIKYGLALVDSGMSLHEVSSRVHSFNASLKSPLSEEEIDRTILVTVSKRYLPEDTNE